MAKEKTRPEEVSIPEGLERRLPKLNDTSLNNPLPIFERAEFRYNEDVKNICYVAGINRDHLIYSFQTSEGKIIPEVHEVHRFSTCMIEEYTTLKK
ncbi:hypothetical protein HOD75_01545 [archaeon]|jgi:hypothetical protein|nr:hypothetical protein [archaeon]MBT4241562.1 hypothetical protein [archaeon]MBT4417566.1 hypothetical protein [archaeon]